jgi:hypothetical protein
MQAKMRRLKYHAALLLSATFTVAYGNRSAVQQMVPCSYDPTAVLPEPAECMRTKHYNSLRCILLGCSHLLTNGLSSKILYASQVSHPDDRSFFLAMFLADLCSYYSNLEFYKKERW